MSSASSPTSGLTIELPTPQRRLEAFELSGPPAWSPPASAQLNRIAYAAVHVVADPLADIDP
ncbi:MAG TPA: DUF993 family protein, partial [Gammaproteobacteria bacterium]|nr:DUF993 family protein [Gammaproteobacteria bacterium]